MFNCYDCGKFLSISRLTEHYRHEHPDTRVCPVPPGGCLSFRLTAGDVSMGKLTRLQVIKVVRRKEQFFWGNVEDLDEEDRLLFIMATRVPYFEDETTVLVWLAACYHPCTIMYSIEARAEMNNVASTMFTGNPVGSKMMEDISRGILKCEDLGQYLCVKDSLINAIEKEGNGVIINTMFHNNIYC